MTPLRQTMIQAMCQHGFSPRTQHSYLYVVTALARYYRRSPDQLKVEDLQVFFNYLVQERSLSPASCRVYLHGIRFLYLKVLHWAHFDVTLVLPKRPQRIPELLTRQEVARLLTVVLNPKHQALLSVTYGCGLRVSEAVALKVKDIDGERHLLRIEQGKGAKDRMVPLAPGVLQALRRYWRIRHPMLWLFPSDLLPDRHLHITTPQKVYHTAKTTSGIEKCGGIHALRHAYATHQLERGLPIHELQRLLGHSDLRSTQRYLHWLPGVTPQNGGPADLIANLGGA
jgi:site-specific recombinase XerD